MAAILKKERAGEISSKDRIKEFAKWRKGLFNQNVKLLSENKDLIGVKHSEGKERFVQTVRVHIMRNTFTNTKRYGTLFQLYQFPFQ